MEIEVNDSNFSEEVLNSDIPVLVDFWAEWCAPCRAIAPYISEMAEKYNGKIKVAKLNVDDNPDTPSKLRISSIPTLVIFKDGKEVGRLIGAGPKKRIEDFIIQNL